MQDIEEKEKQLIQTIKMVVDNVAVLWPVRNDHFELTM